jgi:DNA repair photolyase
VGQSKHQLPLFPGARARTVEYHPTLIGDLAIGRDRGGRFSVSPYHGCELACGGCHARGSDENFDRLVKVRVDAPAAFARVLARPEVQKRGVTLGAASDPYQPAERHFQVTRKMLEKLRDAPAPTALSILTRSDLVRRDRHLLAELSRRHDVTVAIYCSTVDDEILALLEPRAPRAEARMRALSSLAQAGVRAGLLLMPIIPGVTDGEAELAATVQAARAAGARFVHAGALWLDPAGRERFAAWLGERAPDLHARHLAACGTTPAERAAQRRSLDERVARALGAAGYGEPALSEAG